MRSSSIFNFPISHKSCNIFFPPFSIHGNMIADSVKRPVNMSSRPATEFPTLLIPPLFYLVSKLIPFAHLEYSQNPTASQKLLNRNFPFRQILLQFCIAARRWAKQEYPATHRITGRHFPFALRIVEVTLSEIDRYAQFRNNPNPKLIRRHRQRNAPVTVGIYFYPNRVYHSMRRVSIFWITRQKSHFTSTDSMSF